MKLISMQCRAGVVLPPPPTYKTYARHNVVNMGRGLYHITHITCVHRWRKHTNSRDYVMWARSDGLTHTHTHSRVPVRCIACVINAIFRTHTPNEPTRTHTHIFPSFIIVRHFQRDSLCGFKLNQYAIQCVFSWGGDKGGGMEWVQP